MLALRLAQAKAALRAPPRQMAAASRQINTTALRRSRQVPESMWQHPPIPASANLESDRISRLPTETESDRKVLQSLQSLDQYVRELYDECIQSSGPILRGTDEVRFGRKYMGMVALPDYINKAIAEYLQDKDKKLLRHDYLRIADSLRSTGQTTPKGKGRGRAAMEYRREEKLKEEEEDDEELSYRDLGIPTPLPGERVEISIRGVRPPPQSLANPGTPLKPHTLEYGKRESTAYLASYAPATYGVIFNILTELADRLPGFKPQSILDFGSGPAPVLWASQEVWPKFESYQGVDISEDVLQCAESLIADSTIPEDKRARNINFVRYLAPSTNGTSGKSDLVVSTFTLSELPSDDVRKTTVETLWNHTKDILVLVDRGTPDAARMIAEAREQLLELGAKEDSGIHTLAPIPNDLPDPTKDSMSWIHFSQRVQRPNYTMLTKHAKSNLEDLKYSYVIMRRGSRPTVSEPFAPSSSEPVALDVAQQNPEKYLPNGMERKSKERLSLESCSWPRVILPPIKRKGHVLIDVCTVEGKVERWTFTKSHSKQAYRDARKANWGDLFPHTPKSTTVRPGFEPRVKMDPEEKKKAKKNKNKKAYRTTSILDSGE